MRLRGRCVIFVHFVAWRSLEGKFCGPRNKQKKLLESRDWEKRAILKSKVVKWWRPRRWWCHSHQGRKQASNRGNLAHFWDGLWETEPPASGVKRLWPQSSGRDSHLRDSGACLIFSEYIPKSHCTLVTFCCAYVSYFRSCRLIHPSGKGYAYTAYLRQMAQWKLWKPVAV